MGVLIDQPFIRKKVEAGLPPGSVRKVRSFGRDITFRGPAVQKKKRKRSAQIIKDAPLGTGSVSRPEATEKLG